MFWNWKKNKNKEENQEDVQENVQENVQEVAEEVVETADEVSNEAEETADEAASEVAKSTEESASETAESASEAVSETSDIANDAADTEDVQEEESKKKGGLFSRLKAGLNKTRNSFASGIDSIFSGFSKLDEDFYEDLLEQMVMADIGAVNSELIIDELKEKIKEEKINDGATAKEALKDIIKARMSVDESAYEFMDKKSVLLFIGVNGVGKTTSAGKFAALCKNAGKKVMLCAADTFRAGAIDQLKEWSKRANVDIIASNEGADPASVVFDAVSSAKAKNTDILICDTAGRLHNKKNLMAELHKIYTIIDKEYSDAHLETLIVVDATTGQNAMEQAKAFSEVTDIDGVILTKLDGTAKGGIAIAICAKLGIPVKYIGIGESVEDLVRFDPNSYVDAMFDSEE